MAFILAIETSAKSCSVALGSGAQVLASRISIDENYSHAENLHELVRQVLEEAEMKMTGLQAVAVSKGPGSYTGLRIGTSAAKGLCFALNIPLIAISTTRLLFTQAKAQQAGFEVYLPMIDARRMEVYTQPFFSNGTQGPVIAQVVDQTFFAQFSDKWHLVFGDGAAKCESFFNSKTVLLRGILPRAEAMIILANEAFEEKRFEDVAYFEPFYLKDFIAGTPRNNLW